jgi:glycosyltransferase involved in cell wall biosynthesis
LKILHAQNITGIAGSEKYLLSALPALKRAGHDIHFLALHPEKNKDGYREFKAQLEAEGIPVHVLPFRSFPFYSLMKNIKKLQREHSFEVFHSHLIHADFLLALYKKFVNPGACLVSTKHGFQEWYNNKYGFSAMGKRNNVYLRVAKFAERQMDAAIAISKGLRDLYLGMKISKDDKIELIHYGLDFPDPVRQEEEKRFWKNQLVLVGRLTAFKGHRYAIECLPQVLETHPDTGLVIVGSGQLEDELKELVAKLQLQGHVRFLGYSPEARACMASSDIVLVPSVSEGFGVVVLEAFSVKKPIVAFDVPSLNEHIQSGENGFLANPYDLEEYAAFISELLNSESKRSSFGEAGYNKLQDYYSLTRMTEETMSFYDKLNLPRN